MGENEKKDDLFRFVEYSAEEAERTGYSDYSYWKSVFQNFLKKKSAVVMAIVFFALVIFSFIALHIGKYDYAALKQIRLWHSSHRMVNIGSEQITSDVITGARYGMQHRHPLSWR